MIITNKNDLPEGIVEAVKKDYYTKGDAKFSATGLLQPPQIRRLTSLYFDKITIDVSNEIFKLFGSAVHHIIERAQGQVATSGAEVKLANIAALVYEMEQAPTTYQFPLAHIHDALNEKEVDPANHIITEKRLYLTVGDIKISGAPDWYNKIKKKVEDYKVTTVYKVTKGNYDDWEAQLNIYALLLINAGFPVDELQINAILKDFSRKDMIQWRKNASNDSYYPDCPVARVNIPLWKPLDTLKFLITKIEDQMQVEELQDAEEIFAIRPCTLEEKWQKPTRYALMKKGGKRASSVFDTEAEAEGASIAKGREYFVEIRPGYAIRCEEYCSVRDFCAQYKAENENEVSYEEMKTNALKQLEEIVPNEKIDVADNTLSDITGGIAKDIPSVKEIVIERTDDKPLDIAKISTDIITDALNKETEVEPDIPSVPEIIKPKEQDKNVDFDSLTDLMNDL